MGMNKWLLGLPTYLIIDAFGSGLKAVFIFSWNRKPIANIREEKNEQSKRVGSLIGKVLPSCGLISQVNAFCRKEMLLGVSYEK